MAAGSERLVPPEEADAIVEEILEAVFRLRLRGYDVEAPSAVLIDGQRFDVGEHV